MAIIRQCVDLINHKFSDRPQMLIPLTEVDAYADYEELLERERDGGKEYTLYKPIKKKFEISVLLEGIPTEDEVRNIDINQ